MRPPVAADSANAGSGAMFDGIAPRYDLVNRVLSLGIDRRWRRRTVDALALPPGARVLDVATGTADLALAIAARHRDATVVGLDPSANMLAVARRKIAAAGFADRISLVSGDAQALPFAAAAFDGATIAFGIRNVRDRSRALAELARVVRPGGRVCVLELSEPRGGVLGPLARFHVHTLVPAIGALLSSGAEYRYLRDSIARFPPPDAFAAQLAESGLGDVTIAPLTFGVCCLFTAVVPR